MKSLSEKYPNLGQYLTEREQARRSEKLPHRFKMLERSLFDVSAVGDVNLRRRTADRNAEWSLKKRSFQINFEDHSEFDVERAITGFLGRIWKALKLVDQIEGVQKLKGHNTEVAQQLFDELRRINAEFDPRKGVSLITEAELFKNKDPLKMRVGERLEDDVHIVAKSELLHRGAINDIKNYVNSLCKNIYLRPKSMVYGPYYQAEIFLGGVEE